MIAVEADLGVVERLLFLSSEACIGEKAATFACFNEHMNFTVARSTSAIELAA